MPKYVISRSDISLPRFILWRAAALFTCFYIGFFLFPLIAAIVMGLVPLLKVLAVFAGMTAIAAFVASVSEGRAIVRQRFPRSVTVNHDGILRIVTPGETQIIPLNLCDWGTGTGCDDRDRLAFRRRLLRKPAIVISAPSNTKIPENFCLFVDNVDQGIVDLLESCSKRREYSLRRQPLLFQPEFAGGIHTFWLFWASLAMGGAATWGCHSIGVTGPWLIDIFLSVALIIFVVTVALRSDTRWQREFIRSGELRFAMVMCIPPLFAALRGEIPVWLVVASTAAHSAFGYAVGRLLKRMMQSTANEP